MQNELQIIPLEEIKVAENIDLNSNLVDIYRLCLKLKKLCERYQGIGISAVQAGIFKNLFLVKFSDDKYHYFINCEYTPNSIEKILHLEGCLSLKRNNGKLKTYEVERYREISISGYELLTDYDLILEPLNDYVISGFLASVFQHEIDHNYGRSRMIDVIGKEIDIYRK